MKPNDLHRRPQVPTSKSSYVHNDQDSFGAHASIQDHQKATSLGDTTSLRMPPMNDEMVP